MSPDHAGVEVPASSANLGPGFDALGAALDLHLRVWARERGKQRVLPTGEGAAELPTGDDSLLWRALCAYCAHAGVEVPDVSLHADSAIPLERGLGSSSAAAVAGVVLGRALTGAGGADHELLDLAAGLEGHPDNAAAALLGGLVVCLDGRAWRLEPTPSLRPVVCVPATRQSTVVARGLLPAHVTLAVAAQGAARAASVLAGLSGAMTWEPGAMADELHEPARLAAMPDTAQLVAALRDAGIAACLSGAGPSVLAVVPAGDDHAVAAIGERAGAGWTVRPARWDLAGATRLLPVTAEAGAEDAGSP